MRILLVDDETALLDLMGKYLERNGHSVIAAASVAAAKEFLDTPVDVAVIDLSLPDGSGEEVAQLFAERQADARIIIATGYAYTPPDALKNRVGVLQKPFLPRALLGVLTIA